MNDLTNKPGFRTGIAGWPRDDDPWFETASDAERWALEKRSDGVLAVWAGATGETLALVFEGVVFTP